MEIRNELIREHDAQGPTFQRLSAEEKRTAADKAAKMKPVLKKELEKLMRCPPNPKIGA
jgi:hypothetical protein